MVRLGAICILGVGGFGLTHAQGVDLAKDERLTKAISIEQKLGTLAQATTSLSKALGFTIEASPSLKDRKLTVLVKDRPAHAVLGAIASTLDLEWEADGNLLRIKSNTDVAAMERRYGLEEDRLLRETAQTTIKKVIADAQGSFEDATKRDSSITAEKYVLGQHLRSMNQGQWNAFWAGSPVVVRVPQQGATPPQPPGRGQRRQQSFGPLTTAYLRFDPLTGTLEGTVGGQPRASSPGFSGASMNDAPPVGARFASELLQIARPSDKLAEQPFGKRVLEWEKRTRDADFAKPIGGVNVQSGDWFGGRFAASDSLMALHQASGLPVVADAFRVPSQPERGGGTADDWLTRFSRANGMFLRVENGFAMLRHAGFWKLKQLEVPERTLAALEATTSPSLEAYSNFAASLTMLQTELYKRRNATLLKVDGIPFATAMPALKFYGSLGGLQRVARQGKPVAYSAMSGAQRNLFLEAMGLGSPTGRARQINLQRDAASLAFLLSLADMNSPSGVTTGTTMLFGVTPTDGYRFQVPASPQS